MNSKLKRKILSILMLIFMVLGMLIPLVANYTDVFAQEETEEVVNTEDGSENGDGTGDESVNSDDILERKMSANVYSENNSRIAGSLEDATKYNIGMHYLVTYNILKSELGTGKGESPYNKIYYGKGGDAFTGVGQTISSNIGGFSFDPVQMLKDLSSANKQDDVDSDRSPDEGGTTAGDSDPTVDSDRDELAEEQARTEISSLVDRASTEIVAAMMPQIMKYYGLNKSKIAMEDVDIVSTVNSTANNNDETFWDTVDVALDRAGDVIFADEDGDYKNDRESRVAFANGKSIYEANQSSIKMGTGGISETNNLFKKALKEEVSDRLSRGSLTKGSINEKELDNILKHAEERYRQNFASMFKLSKTEMSKLQLTHNVFGAHNTVPLVAGEKVSSVDEDVAVRYDGSYISGKRKVFQFVVTPEYAKNRRDAYGIAKNRGLNFLSSSFYTVKRYVYRSESVENRAFKDIKSTVEKAAQSGSYKEFLNKNDELAPSVNGDWSLLSWTPLFTTISDTDLLNFGKLVEDISNGKYRIANNTFKDDSGSLRPLLGMDLFMKQNSPSPVLFGLYGKGNVTLHLGHEAGLVQSRANMTHEMIGAKGTLGDEGNFQLLKSLGVGESGSLLRGRTQGLRVLSLATGVYSTYGSGFEGDNVSGDVVIGMDSYGNIINGSSGDVYVPYWQVDFMLYDGASLSLTNNLYQFAPSITGAKGDYFEFAKSQDSPKLQSIVKARKTTAEIADMIGIEDSKLRDAVNEINKQIHGKDLTYEEAQKFVKEGTNNLDRDMTIKALSAIITANTSDAVKQYNSQMLKDAKDGKVLFVATDNDLDGLYNDQDGNDAVGLGDKRWSAARLIQKFGQLIDYGVGEVVRNSTASMLGRMYNSDFSSSTLSKVFYTDTVANVSRWSAIALPVTIILGFILAFNLLRMAYTHFRSGGLNFKRLVTRFFVLALVLFYPIYIYGPMVDLVLNRPGEEVLSRHMRVSSILDTYIVREGNELEKNEYYENMFGEGASSKDLQMGSYILDFYTTRDVEGFDINETDSDDPNLGSQAKARLERYQKYGEDYPKEYLQVVRVPLMDLYSWVWDVSYGGDASLPEDSGYNEGGEVLEDTTNVNDSPNVRDTDADGNVGVIDGSERMLTYEEGVKSGQVKPLFEWLADGGSSRFPVDGYQTEIRDYREYGFNQYQRLLDKTMEDITDEGGIGDFYETLARIDYGYLTGSQLFYEVVYAASQEGVNYNLSRLHILSELFNSVTPEAEGVYIPTEGNKRSLIRDLSSTSKTREIWYGDRRWSNFTKNVFKGSSGEITNTDGETKSLLVQPELEEPKEDFLGLTLLIDNITSKRDDLRAIYYKTLGTMVYDVNSKALMNYLSNYGIVRRGLVNVRSEETLAHAEKMIMATEAYFQLNRALDYRNFPREFKSKSISFDKYLALLYVPFSDYGRDVLTFIDEETATPRSTAEYIAFNDTIFGVIIFSLSVVSLIIFGIVYTFVFYVLLLILSMYNFIKYYFIKEDYKNKSVFGVFFILLSLGLVKLGVMMTFAVGTWVMNTQIAYSSIGKPSYPTTVVHGTAIIVVVWLGLIFVIGRTVKNVIQDKENLGGQRGIDNLGDTFNKLTNGRFSGKGGAGLDRKSANSEFKEELGGKGLGLDDKKKANRLGKLDEYGLGKVRDKVGHGLGVGSKLLNSKAREKRMLSYIENSLRRKNLSKKVESDSKETTRKRINSDLFVTNNAVHSDLARSLATTINGMDTSVRGVNRSVYNKAINGELISTSTLDKMTTMTLSSVGAAKRLSADLTAKGINNYRRGREVYFESGGYDLTQATVRNELFGNTVAGLTELVRNNKLLGRRGTLKKGYQTNKYMMSSDGNVMMYFGKDGLSESSYKELFESDEFSSSFVRPNISSNLGTDGNVHGWVPIKYKNPTLPNKDKRSRIDRVFRADNRLRKDIGLGKRVDNNLRGVIKIEGSAGSLQRLKDNKILNRHLQAGMLMQGDEILYNKDNKLHVQAISKIEKELKLFNNSVNSEFGKDSLKLAAYIAKDGDNVGLPVRTQSAKDDPIKAASLYGTKDTDIIERRFKVSNNNQPVTYDRVLKLQNIKDAINGGNLDKVSEFATNKMELISEFKSKKLQDKSKAQELSGDLVNFLNNEPKSNSNEVKGLVKELGRVNTALSKNKITEAQANSVISKINDNIVSLLETYGYLDSYITTKHSDLSKVGKYESSLRDLEGGKSNRSDYMSVPYKAIMSMAYKDISDDSFDYKDGMLIHRVKNGRRGAIDEKDSNDIVLSYLTDRPLDFRDVKSRQLE